jgi:HAD superfamily hydrolase (TIGR01459 family)
VFITNAPRPGDSVIRQIDQLKVPREAYDGIVSSGDVTRDVIMQRKGQSLCHIGPPRDQPIFAGLPVKFAPLESADYVVCSGLDEDDIETPEDYRPRLEIMLKRKLFMLCGNPDLVVERGDKLVYCAGSVADLYATMGGEVLYAGKPYRPIYDMALRTAEVVSGRKTDIKRVMAIGDSVRTDLKGARAFGIDMLFMAAGIHAEEFGGRDTPNAEAMKTVFTAAGEMPTAVMKHLTW